MVHARCTLHRGAFGKLACPCADDGYSIKGSEKYVFLTCTDSCRMHFHQGCWKDFESTYKETHSQWKLKRGVMCVTNGCPGDLSYCALQHGPDRHPQDVLVLVHAAEKEAPQPKPRKKDKLKPQKDNAQQQKSTREQDRPHRQDLRHVTGRHTAAEKAELQPLPTAADGPVKLYMPIAQTKGSKEGVPAPKPPTLDVSKIEFDSLMPVHRVAEESSDARGIAQAKKERKSTKQPKHKQIIQPNFHTADVEELESSTWDTDIFKELVATTDFFQELEQERERGFTDSHDKTINTSRAVEFPNLEEANLATENPDLFKYIGNVLEIVSSLRLDNPTEATPTLLIEFIDLEALAELGTMPEPHLKGLLTAFGQIEKFRLFEFLGIACIQYSKPVEASSALEALDRTRIGHKYISVHFMCLFPSEVLLRHRLGDRVWEMYRHSDADLSSISEARTRQREKEREERQKEMKREQRAREMGREEEERRREREKRQGERVREEAMRQEVNERECLSRLDAAAKAYTPSYGADRQSSSELQVVSLPPQLAQFKATEVIGCDSNSLKAYFEEGEAFGVLPEQLVNQGFDSAPTALVMYQIDDLKLYGLWRIADRQIANRQQVAFVRLVELYPALPQAVLKNLLVRNEGRDGLVQYPQLLDGQKTQTLMHMLHSKKASNSQPQRAASRTESVARTEASGIATTVMEEALELLRQAQEDEELARELQEELNKNTVPSAQETNDEQLARHLQLEEEKGALPSYSSAVRQNTYRIPPKSGTTTIPPPLARRPPSDMVGMASTIPGLFNDLFPSAASSAQEPLQPRPAPSGSRTASMAADDIAAGGTWSVQDTSLGGEAWREKVSQGSDAAAWGTESITDVVDTVPKGYTRANGSLEAVQPASRAPTYQPPSYRPPLAAVMQKPEHVQDDSASMHADLLSTLLGIELPEASQASSSPNLQNKTSQNSISNYHQQPPPGSFVRTGSKISLSSSDSDAQENVVGRDRKLIRPHVCIICSLNPSNYVCRPCKHWGPCISCCPSAVDKDEMYPCCMRCKETIEQLIRVYQR